MLLEIQSAMKDYYVHRSSKNLFLMFEMAHILEGMNGYRIAANKGYSLWHANGWYRTYGDVTLRHCVLMTEHIFTEMERHGNPVKVSLGTRIDLHQVYNPLFDLHKFTIKIPIKFFLLG